MYETASIDSEGGPVRGCYHDAYEVNAVSSRLGGPPYDGINPRSVWSGGSVLMSGMPLYFPHTHPSLGS